MSSNDELMALLRRANDIVTSAYETPEWLQHGRTEETDKTMDDLAKAVSEDRTEGRSR